MFGKLSTCQSFELNNEVLKYISSNFDQLYLGSMPRGIHSYLQDKGTP